MSEASPGSHVKTRRAFAEAIEEFGPDDFYTLTRSFEAHFEGMSLAEMLALLHLSGEDASVILQAIPVLLKRVETASDDQKKSLYRAIFSAWEAYFHLGEKPDLPFHLGLLLYKMGHVCEALSFFNHSYKLYGADPGTTFNLAICYYDLQQMDKALLWSRETLRLEPAHEQAAAMLAEIERPRI